MLTSPYNFVPLNSKVYLPDWSDKVSQDIPFEDGEDGYIEVTWHNYSPLFIRNEDKNNPDPIHIDINGNRRYFIPGSSIKGMLRNTLSILAFGKMAEGEQYNDRFFGHREIGTDSQYVTKMNDVKFGWIEQYQDNGKDKYRLYPCDGRYIKLPIRLNEDDANENYIERFFPNYNNKRTPWERNEVIKNKSGKWFPEIIPGYRLYVSGKMDGKLHEILIPTKTKNPIELSDEIICKFFTVYESTPGFAVYFDRGIKKGFRALLDQGEQLPVSYIEESNEIVAIGMGRMFRYPYNNGVKDLIIKRQQLSEYKELPDLCETIFGRIGNKESIKGRIQIGNAWSTNCINLCKEDKGVLGQPKSSYYPFYVEQNNSTNRYNSYTDNNICISGRKRYRIHSGETTEVLPRGNGNENVMTKFKAIPTGQDFRMRINVHNARPIEIGAILSAITLHNNDGVYHNIGAAKSFGYGKIKANSITLHNLKYSIEHYLSEFEYTMDLFLNGGTSGVQKWNNTTIVRTLLGIASEHNSDDVQMMELQQYKSSKNIQTEGKTILRDDFDNATSLVSDTFRKEYLKKEALSIDSTFKSIINQCENNDKILIIQLTILFEKANALIMEKNRLGIEPSTDIDARTSISDTLRAAITRTKKSDWERRHTEIKIHLRTLDTESADRDRLVSIKSSLDSVLDKATRIANEMIAMEVDASHIQQTIDEINETANKIKIRIESIDTMANTIAFRSSNRNLYEEADVYIIPIDIDKDNLNQLKIAKDSYTTAVNLYETIVSKMTAEGLDHTEEDKKIEALNSKIDEIDKRIDELKSTVTLRDILEEKMPNGQYKVKEWKVCKQRVDQYLRDHTMTEDDREALCVTVRRLSENPSRDERRSNAWAKRDSNVWKGIETYLGKEATDRLFDEINTK